MSREKDKNLLALIDFSNQINSNLELSFILQNLLFTIFAKFLISKGAILLFDSNRNLKIAEIKGFEKAPEILIGSLEEFAEQTQMINIFPIIFNEKKLGYLLLADKFNGEKISNGDKRFLTTLLGVAATAIENSINFKKLAEVNRNLDSKINQLNSLFDLAKEFTGVFDVKSATKIFLFSIIGQFMITKYAVVSCDVKEGIIESKFNNEILKNIFYDKKFCAEKPVLTENSKDNEGKILLDTGVELIVPMQYKNKTEGLILLGKRAGGLKYTKSDIEYIYSVGSLAIISFQNSRLFNEYLEKQKIEKDLELARKIQRNLLPQKIPKSNVFEISAINIPARQVGGDYYDIIKLKNGKILIVIADVSGKGMQASLLMSNIQAVIKTLSKFDYSISKATDLLNDLIAENTSDGNFITMFWGLLDEEDGTFEYVNAGHNPPILLGENGITDLTKGGMIIGVMKTVLHYESEKLKINNGDKIILYTDGITEAMDENFNEYSEERLNSLLLNLKTESAEEIINTIFTDVRKHTGDAEQSDDITLMVVNKIS